MMVATGRVMSDDELRERLISAYRGRKRAMFDEIATALEGAVLDVLLGTIAPARRAELEADLQPLAQHNEYRAWLEGERGGPDAGLVLAARCRDYLFGLKSRAPEWDQHVGVDPLRELAAVFASRPEPPWILLEVMRGSSKGLVLVQRALGWSLNDLGPRAFAAYRSAILTKDEGRWEYLRKLVYADAIDPELALLTIDEPDVHRYTEPVLLAHAAANVDRLREIVDHATEPRVRELALRVLRHADKDLTPEGTKASTPLEKVEADLRRDPSDADASQVWADALAETGDPRGTYVSLEHAIRAAVAAGDAARAFEQSTEQANLLRDHRDALLGRAGGFPFREPFAGRTLLRVRSPEPFHSQPLKAAVAFERAQAFVRAHGDVGGPSAIHFADCRAPAFREPMNPEVEPVLEEERACLELLAPARLYRAREGHTFVERDDASAPLVDEKALAELVLRTTTLTLVYVFAHVQDGVPLPYQEDVRFPNRLDNHRGRLCSRLQVAPHVKKESLVDLVFPFESIDDPAFASRFELLVKSWGTMPMSALEFFQLGPEARELKPPKGLGKKPK